MRTRMLAAVAAVLFAAMPAFAQAPAKKAKPKPPAAATDDKTPPAAAPAPAADAKLTVKDVVGRMQKFYESTIDLHAKFDQEVTNPIRGPKKFSGDVWLKKPGRMRWDYQKPEKKFMVADGSTLWVCEPEVDQCIKQPLKESTLPTSVTFLFGTGKLTDEFDVTEEHPEGMGTPGDLVLKLVPKKPTAQFRYLMFVVDPKRYLVKESYIYDQQDGVNHMHFRDVETNRGVGNAKFEFTPPNGTQIIHP